MERVTGIGGVFFRARDPDALAAWYENNLGVPREPDQSYGIFPESRNTVWSAFEDDTDYWTAAKQGMVNYTVRDLDAMLSQLRDADVEVDDTTHEVEGIGRFGWAVDPEGNRFELWEPAVQLRAVE
jgi:predicted enzyme related to lactoylglutathione lyase